jgi:hypothetical protein
MQGISLAGQWNGGPGEALDGDYSGSKTNFLSLAELQLRHNG